ncbi:MAG: ABC transporter permease, partial [Pseudomonadales bacterium]
MTASATKIASRFNPGQLLNRNLIDATLFFIALALIWEFSVRFFEIKAYLLPSITDILRSFWSSRALLWEHSLITLGEVLWGFAAAVALGIPIAALIFFVPVAKRTIYPFMIALQSIPKIGLAPIIVVWFGYGLSSKVIMAFLFAFFPIVISTLGGLGGTPAHLEEHFRALGASRWVTFWRLRVPSALPNFVDGCKVAMPLAVIGAIVGEFVGSNDGLGNLILLATGSSNTPLTFAALGAVTALSLMLFYIIEWLGRLVWW